MISKKIASKINQLLGDEIRTLKPIKPGTYKEINGTREIIVQPKE